MDFFAILISAIIAATAWLYQKTWERQEIRRNSYQTFLELFPALLASTLDHEDIDKILLEMRRMLFFAPDHVIVSAEAFLETLEGESSQKEKFDRLSKLLIAMRQDVSFLSSLLPKFFRTKLQSTRIVLLSASHPKNK